MQDGDDILMKDKLEKQILFCKENGINFCSCEYWKIDDNNNIIGTDNATFITKWFYKKNSYKENMII